MSQKEFVPVNQNYRGISMVRDSVHALGAQRILSYEVGNEPDWFSNNRGWDKNKYMARGGFYDRCADEPAVCSTVGL